MRNEVLVQFDAGRSIEIPVSAGDVLAPDVARQWLDDEFVRLQCEPLRASGKVLTIDKLLAVAEAAGPFGFEDVAWRSEFAQATLGALARQVVTVDLVSMRVS